MTGETAERLLTERAEFWAHVEVIGRREHWGKVTIESIGGAAFFRVDVPDKPPVTERERGYYRVEGDQVGVNTYGLYEVTRGPVAGQTFLIGTGSIYQITPVPEEVARAQAAKRAHGEVLNVVRIEEVKAIGSGVVDDDDATDGYAEDDDEEDDEEEEEDDDDQEEFPY